MNKKVIEFDIKEFMKMFEKKYYEFDVEIIVDFENDFCLYLMYGKNEIFVGLEVVLVDDIYRIVGKLWSSY